MNKEDPELILGRMRCLEALGEWYVSCKSSQALAFINMYVKNETEKIELTLGPSFSLRTLLLMENTELEVLHSSLLLFFFFIASRQPVANES